MTVRITLDVTPELAKILDEAVKRGHFAEFPIDSAATLLEECVRELRDVSPAGEHRLLPPPKRYPYLDRLLRALDDTCFMVTTAVGAIPLHLRKQEKESLRWAKEATAKAILKGTTVIEIIPSPQYVKSLNDTCGFTDGESIVEDTKKRFDSFQSYLASMLPPQQGESSSDNTEAKNGPQVLRSHLILSDHFPLTSAREMVSLIGKSNGGGSVQLYVLNVSPAYLGISMLPESRAIEDDLRKYIDKVITPILAKNAETTPQAAELQATLGRLRVLMSGHLLST